MFFSVICGKETLAPNGAARGYRHGPFTGGTILCRKGNRRNAGFYAYDYAVFAHRRNRCVAAFERNLGV